MPTDTNHILDAFLVLDAQAGNPESLGTLLQRWYPRWTRHADRFTKDTDLAKDATQDAALAIARTIRKLKDPERFRAWSYRIVTRKAITIVRTRARQRGLADRSAATLIAAQATNPPADQLAEEHETHDRVRALVAQLDDEHRIVMELYYGEELALGEIAHVLNIPRGTIKSRLFHARRSIAGALLEAHQGDAP